MEDWGCRCRRAESLAQGTQSWTGLEWDKLPYILGQREQEGPRRVKGFAGRLGQIKGQLHTESGG